MIDSDDKIAPFREIVDAVHAEGTPILIQIAHCGRQMRTQVTGLPTVASSAIRDKFYSETVPQAMSEVQIKAIITNFKAAIVRTQKAGFDGVQLHMAHGYLLSQFLSASTCIMCNYCALIAETKALRCCQGVLPQAS